MGRSLASVLLALVISLSSPMLLLAGGVSCPENDVTVLGADERAEDICEATSEVIEQLASCNLTVPSAVTVEITHAMPNNCLGLYHCEDNLIQLLPIEAYATFLAGSPDSPFGHLEPNVFFNSVLRHELAHAALHRMPCPFEGCPATSEFVAHTMQIFFLPEAARAPFDQRVSDAEGSAFREGISVLALMMARDAFITNAYAYLSQQDDPCRLISDVAEGEQLFDLPVR